MFAQTLCAPRRASAERLRMQRRSSPRYRSRVTASVYAYGKQYGTSGHVHVGVALAVSDRHRGLQQTSRHRMRVVSQAAGTDTPLHETATTPTEDVGPEAARLRQLDDLPREAGLPIVGTLLQIADEGFEVSTLFEKHNTDAFMINLGPGYGWQLCIQSPDLMEQVQVTQGKDLYPKWGAATENLLLPKGVSLTNEEARPWRTAVSKVLATGTLMHLHLPLMINEFTTALRKVAASQEEVKFYDMAKRLTFSAASRAAIGDVLSHKELDDLFPIAKTFGQGAWDISFGLKEGLPGTNHWRAHQARKVLVRFLAERIYTVLQNDRSQVQEQENVNPTVLTRVIKVLEDEGVDTSVQDEMDVATRLAKEVLMLQFTGTDSTSYSIARCMMWLSKHPEWLAALNEEQDRLVAEFGPELDRKVYSRSAVALAITQEVLRLTPPVKILFRRAQQDLVIGDIVIPEGTDITLAPRKAILETGSGTRSFDPQHWLSEDRTECKVNDEYNNFVFGKGARYCIGKNLAMVQLVAYLAILGREASNIEMAQEDQERTFYIVGQHPTGLPLRLTPRV